MSDDLAFPALAPGESAERGGWTLLRARDRFVLSTPEGTSVTVALSETPASAEPRTNGRVLVLGGARSGKSAYAERRLAAAPAVTYVATAFARPNDPEWVARVDAHRVRRPEHWRTVETSDVAAVLRSDPGPLLIDCISLWLGGVIDEPDCAARVDDLVDAWSTRSTPVVAVSSEVGSGVVPPTEIGRRYRDALGRLNARLAAEADEVWLVTAGLPRRLA